MRTAGGPQASHEEEPHRRREEEVPLPPLPQRRLRVQVRSQTTPEERACAQGGGADACGGGAAGDGAESVRCRQFNVGGNSQDERGVSTNREVVSQARRRVRQIFRVSTSVFIGTQVVSATGACFPNMATSVQAAAS